MPPRTSSWRYFQARMAARYRLRRQLRQLQLFLDPLSAAALRPGNSPEAIAEVEAALQVGVAGAHGDDFGRWGGSGREKGSSPHQVIHPSRPLPLPPPQLPLPTELYELYRFCDGQDQERGGVRCIDDARLLSLHEMRAAVQERHGPLEGPRELARLKRQRAQPAPQADGSSSGGGGTARHGEAGPSSTSDELPPPAPDFLLPFTAELRGRRRFALCLEGRCWLVSGFNTIAFAPSLADLIRRTLT